MLSICLRRVATRVSIVVFVGHDSQVLGSLRETSCKLTVLCLANDKRIYETDNVASEYWKPLKYEIVYSTSKL